MLKSATIFYLTFFGVQSSNKDCTTLVPTDMFQDLVIIIFDKQVNTPVKL